MWRLVLSPNPVDWDSFPRPVPDTMDSVLLSVESGRIDLLPLKQAADMTLIAMWYWRLMRPGGISTSIECKILFSNMMATKKDLALSQSVEGQLAHFLAGRFDSLFIKSNASDDGGWHAAESPFPHLSSRYVRYCDLESSYQTEHMLTRYLLACREHAAGGKHYLLGTDAHDGCGRKYLNTVVTFPDTNLALVAPPQALFEIMRSTQSS